jgi:hypothetical protein
MNSNVGSIHLALTFERDHAKLLSLKKSWSKSIITLQKKFNLSMLEISETQFMTDIKKYYTNKLTNCLKNIGNISL